MSKKDEIQLEDLALLTAIFFIILLAFQNWIIALVIILVIFGIWRKYFNK